MYLVRILQRSLTSVEKLDMYEAKKCQALQHSTRFKITHNEMRTMCTILLISIENNGTLLTRHDAYFGAEYTCIACQNTCQKALCAHKLIRGRGAATYRPAVRNVEVQTVHANCQVYP